MTVLILGAGIIALSQNRVATSTTAVGKNGVVVSTQHEASEVGLNILKQGGNAIDAAIAVGYALAVTDPCCGNLGGGGFMLIHLANGQETFLNFREKAPQAATQDMYLDSEGKVIPRLSTRGYRSVAVPGTVLGLEQARTLYGTLSRSALMAPAIELAERGFILQPGDINILNDETEEFLQEPNVAAIFLKNGQTPYQVGDRLVQTDLAQTLKLIAKSGADAFYRGPIAAKVVQASAASEGILTLEDFANYTVSQAPPVHCNYRGYEVISSPPPGGGTTLCQMLNILNGYPLEKLGFRTAASLHPMLSAMLYAYADRNTYLGDPDFVTNPVDRLLSPAYAAQIRAKIPRDRAIPPEQLYRSTPPQEGTQTTHHSVQDRYGNAVAVTYTINGYFGARVIAGDSGFFLNNEMDDFTSKPGSANIYGLVQGSANVIAPGKRPLSSMSPTIVLNKGKNRSKVFLVTGSPGGSTIPTTVLQIITNLIDYGMTLSAAVSTPRIHYQGLPNRVGVEPNALKLETISQLWKMDYKVIPTPFVWGAAESILTNPDTGEFNGVNDPRKPAGKAVAY